jgi:hypothetical protein
MRFETTFAHEKTPMQHFVDAASGLKQERLAAEPRRPYFIFVVVVLSSKVSENAAPVDRMHPAHRAGYFLAAVAIER